jgi:hypothetical protein
MRPAERLALAIVLALGVLTFGTAGAAVYVWHHSGSLRLAVHDNGPDGGDLALSLPGAIVNAAIALCPLPVDLATDERLQAVLPALRDAADQLASMPDVVLVDVDDHGDRVRIAKSGSELVIRVVSTEERVEITVPIESVRRLVARLEAKAAA